MSCISPLAEVRVHVPLLQAIVDSVKSSPTLERLNISANAAGSGTCQALVALMRLNNTVTELDASCNSFGEEGGHALKRALENNTGVRVGRPGRRTYACMGCGVCAQASTKGPKRDGSPTATLSHPPTP